MEKLSEFQTTMAEKQGLKFLDGKFKGIKQCRICNKSFEYIADSPYHIIPFCSSKCEIVFYTRKETCKFCQKEFEYDIRRNLSNSLKFCSLKCEEKAKKEAHIIWIKNKIEKELPLKYHKIETDKEKLLEECLGKSLFLWGSAGTGKSVFMASLAKVYIKQNKYVKWISFPSFIMEIQNAFKNANKRYEEFSHIKSPYDLAEEVATYEGILCIDDLGAEKLTEFVRQIMYYIINEREERILQTIITSNLSLSEIDEYIASRISSRIAGICEILKFTGKDRRLTK